MEKGVFRLKAGAWTAAGEEEVKAADSMGLTDMCRAVCVREGWTYLEEDDWPSFEGLDDTPDWELDRILGDLGLDGSGGTCRRRTPEETDGMRRELLLSYFSKPDAMHPKAAYLAGAALCG